MEELNSNRVRVFTIGVVLVAALAVALAPRLVSREQAAYAERVRERCITTLNGAKSWGATITRTDTSSDGTSKVVRQDVLVRKPGEYRLVMRETDEKGRPVISTTIRTLTALYIRTAEADGSTRLHVINGMPPSLGVCLDNALGETVSAMAESQQLKIVGRGVRDGREVDELSLGYGRSVWVDRATGVPVAEQEKAGDRVIVDIAYTDMVVDESFDNSLFDSAALGKVETTTVEDLGFRPVDSAGAARASLGFTPLAVTGPEGYTLGIQGYVDPAVSDPENPSPAAFITVFSNGLQQLLVTQTLRPDLKGSLASQMSEESKQVDIGGQPAALTTGTTSRRILTLRGDVLVVVEGQLPESDLIRAANSIL